jgi:hypothetical protein
MKGRPIFGFFGGGGGGRYQQPKLTYVQFEELLRNETNIKVAVVI